MGLGDYFADLFGTGDEEDGTVSDAESDDGGEFEFEEAMEDEAFAEEGGGTDPAVDDLRVRLDELESELESNETSIRSMQSSQEQINEELREMNDRVRRLLGVYDQVTADANPFDSGSGNGFGVVEEPAAESSSAGHGSDGAPGGADPSEPEAEDDGVVSFEDLEAGLGGNGAEAEPDPGATADSEAADSGATVESHHEPVAEEANAAGAAAVENGAGAEGADAGHTLSEEAGSPPLDRLPDGYATDLLILEWLSELVTRAGPAGALKALSYYERVGWLEPAARNRIERVLGGPHIDAGVDPNCPQELTGADHAESYQYIRKLATLDGTGL